MKFLQKLKMAKPLFNENLVNFVKSFIKEDSFISDIYESKIKEYFPNSKVVYKNYESEIEATVIVYDKYKFIFNACESNKQNYCIEGVVINDKIQILRYGSLEGEMKEHILDFKSLLSKYVNTIDFDKKDIINILTDLLVDANIISNIEFYDIKFHSHEEIEKWQYDDFIFLNEILRRGVKNKVFEKLSYEYYKKRLDSVCLIQAEIRKWLTQCRSKRLPTWFIDSIY